MEPTKTEYKGIVFDSKSEAVFARVLDMACHEWVYHPNPHCGHQWDFLLFCRAVACAPQTISIGDTRYFSQNRESEKREPIERPTLIEYKPSAPTETYMRNLARRMARQPVKSIVVWGNPWSEVPSNLAEISGCRFYCAQTICRGYGDHFNEPQHVTDDFGEVFAVRDVLYSLGISDNRVQEAKKYRFDLANGGWQ